MPDIHTVAHAFGQDNDPVDLVVIANRFRAILQTNDLVAWDKLRRETAPDVLVAAVRAVNAGKRESEAA